MGAFWEPKRPDRSRSHPSHPSVPTGYLAIYPVSSKCHVAFPVNRCTFRVGACPPAATVNLRVNEAQDGRGVAGILAHAQGHRTAAEHAAAAAKIRPRGAPRQLRPLTSRAAASVCALWQVLHLDGGGARAAAVAALGRRGKPLKIFARLRRAELLARLRRAREVPETFRRRPRARFCVTVPMGGTWSGGSKRDKKILLHQSIDLDELYPTVPVAQIVRRRKYFLPKMRGYVHCTRRK